MKVIILLSIRPRLLYNRHPRPLPLRIPSDCSRAPRAPRALHSQSQAAPVGLGQHSPPQLGACPSTLGNHCLCSGLRSALMISVLYRRILSPTQSLQMKPVLRLAGTIWRTSRWQRHCRLPVAVAPRLLRRAWLAMVDIQSTAILSVSDRNQRCAVIRLLKGHHEPYNYRAALSTKCEM